MVYFDISGKPIEMERLAATSYTNSVATVSVSAGDAEERTVFSSDPEPARRAIDHGGATTVPDGNRSSSRAPDILKYELLIFLILMLQFFLLMIKYRAFKDNHLKCLEDNQMTRKGNEDEPEENW